MSYWGAALVSLISMSRRGDERREERMSPPVKFFSKAWFFPLSLAAAAQGCPVILPLRCNCCETWRNKVFFFFPCPGVTGVTLSSHPPLPSPPLPSIPDHWNSLSLRQKTLPMQPGKNAPPSARSHLLFIVCFLTFISNSFHWHMKSWQGRDRAREGMRDGERGTRGAMKGRRRGLSFLFVAKLQHVHILSDQNKNRNAIWRPRLLNRSLQTMTWTLADCGCFGPSESPEVQILLACLSRNKHQGKHPNKCYL